MRLLSATVRAYRLHRETTVVFDPHRTLIGGPNEAGKSTFTEALHRALFFKAKGNTNDHRLMKSTVHQGTPEVELSFASGGGVYQLKKRFGSSGDTHLTPPRGAVLTGDAAETELARLLGVEAGVSGKTALGQWAHLWVWQGQSADDPTPHASSQRDSLLQRLQSLGGAAAMQSACDTRTATAAAAAWEELYTSGGKVKANSPLAQAEAAATEAEAAETAARARAEALVESVRSFTESETQLAQWSRDAVDLTVQQEEALRQEALIRQHRAEETAQAAAAAQAAAKRTALEQQEAQLTEIRRRIAGLEAELAPLEEATASLTEQEAASAEAAAAAGRACEVAGDAMIRARQHHDLASAWLKRHETAASLEALTQRAAQAAEHQAEVEKIRLELAALPPVEGDTLAALQKLDAACHAAEAALTAMAAGVEFLAGGVTVRLGGQILTPGETRILTEETELEVGDACRLRVRPGGGTSLAGAREKEQQARRQCQAALEKAGVGSLDEAVKAAARRSSLTAQLLAGQASLKSLQAATLPALLAEAQAEYAAATAETDRRTAAMGPAAETGAAFTAESARAAVRESARRLAEAESAAKLTKAQRDAATLTASSQARVLSDHRESLRGRQQQLTGLLAQGELLLTNHGPDRERAAALTAAIREQETTAATLTATRQRLEALQPEHCARNLERLQRGLEVLRGQRSAAETQRAVAADQLKSDGSQDPEAALALATARALAARETLQRLQRQASARDLLYRTFTAEQSALADRFTRPLADRISGYLECLFGPGTRASVVLRDQEFSGLEITRPGQAGGAFAFDHLSGGTREQTAAAVRLAMAEVLAEDHDGTLPVVFDDAFAYSDATRLRQLQNMLDLAASRGLQVILLTHQPAGYAALGAKAVLLG